MTNPALLQQVYNQDALLEILCYFKRFKMGSLVFREKIAQILQTMVEKKKWVELSDSQKIADLIGCLREIDAIKFSTLLSQIQEEFRISVDNQECTSLDLVRIYLSQMSIYKKSALSTEDKVQIDEFT